MKARRVITDLRCELRETQHALQCVEAELLEARERAERAERTAREAWDFAKVLFHMPVTRCIDKLGDAGVRCRS